MKTGNDIQNDPTPKEKWETPELQRDSVQSTTEAGFPSGQVRQEDLFYNDS